MRAPCDLLAFLHATAISEGLFFLQNGYLYGMLEIGQRAGNENHSGQTYMGLLCLGDKIFGAKSADSTRKAVVIHSVSRRMLGLSHTRSAAIRKKKIVACGVHLPRGSKHASILFVLVS